MLENEREMKQSKESSFDIRTHFARVPCSKTYKAQDETDKEYRPRDNAQCFRAGIGFNSKHQHKYNDG